MLEKTNEYQMEIHLLFVDLQKAFDAVNHIYLWDALLNQGVRLKMIKILQEFYKDNKAYINMDKEGPMFEVQKGVKQGDPLSPNLFNCILEEIFKETKLGDTDTGADIGININGKRLTNLRFAEDIVLMGKSTKKKSK